MGFIKNQSVPTISLKVIENRYMVYNIYLGNDFSFYIYGFESTAQIKMGKWIISTNIETIYETIFQRLQITEYRDK